MADNPELRVALPTRQLLAVEHPCHVRDADRAVRMLGGTRAIGKASLNGTAFLECHLRPNDPLSHPLFGELVRTPAVLLKVRRRRVRPSGEGGSDDAQRATPTVTAEAVGVVRHSYRFAGLADFQYVSRPELLDALSALPSESAGAVPQTADGSTSDEPKSGTWLDRSALAAHGCAVGPALFLSRDLPLDVLQLRPEAALKPSMQEKLRKLEMHEEEPKPRKRRAPRRAGGVKMHFGQVHRRSRHVAGPVWRPVRFGRARSGRPPRAHCTSHWRCRPALFNSRPCAQRGPAARPPLPSVPFTAPSLAQVVGFDVARVPQAAEEAVQQQIDPTDEVFIAMRSRFAERPIWSGAARRCKSGMPRVRAAASVSGLGCLGEGGAPRQEWHPIHPLRSTLRERWLRNG